MSANIEAEVITEIARPEDVLPEVLHILPLEKKPFFPGQILPIVLDAERWGDTIKAIHESGHRNVGVVYPDGVKAENVESKDFKSVGTVCKIHQIERHENLFHVVLAGMQRFEIVRWVLEEASIHSAGEILPRFKPSRNRRDQGLCHCHRQYHQGVAAA